MKSSTSKPPVHVCGLHQSLQQAMLPFGTLCFLLAGVRLLNTLLNSSLNLKDVLLS